MSANKSYGALFRLPREIRDEIYSHYFDKIYVVFWSYYKYTSYQRSVQKDYSGKLADLAILRISQSISSDATNILYSKAASKATTFKYDFRLNPRWIHSLPPTKQATDRMTNVEFEVLLDYEFQELHTDQEGDSGAFKMEPLCEATVDRFVGTSVLRDSFRITFRLKEGNKGMAQVDASFGHLTRTRFFQTLKIFNGFRKLHVVLIWKPDDRWSVSRGQKNVGKVKKQLEPHLGPCSVKSEYCSRRGDDTTIELEFQPLKFHQGSLRADAALAAETGQGSEQA